MGTKKYWLGVDIGGTKMLAVLYDQDFKALAEHKDKTKGLEGPKAVISRLTALIHTTLEAAGLRRTQLGGVGVGCPGPLDLPRGVVVAAPNLGWRNVPLKNILEDEFHRPALILNDVDAGTYGEYRFGAGEQARCVIGLFPGTGIGGGCVYDGQLIRGRVKSCFEVGHMVIMPGGRLCGCGQHGCLEAHASRLAIATDAIAAVHRGRAPVLGQLAGMGVKAIKSRTLARAIVEGDTTVEGLVRQAAHLLGRASASLVNLLAPDVLVLGGGLVEAMEPIYLEEVRKAIHQYAMPFLAKDTKVRAARLGDHAGVMGAAALAAAAFDKSRNQK